MRHIDEPAGIDSMHQADGIMTNAQQPNATDKPGEESFPQNDVEKTDANRLRRNQAKPHESGRVEDDTDYR